MAIDTLQANPLPRILAVEDAPLRHLRFDNFPLLPVLVNAAQFDPPHLREPESMRLAAIAVVCGLSAFAAKPALADSCPQLMDKFDDALVKATADDSVPFEDRATALALHDEGEALYEEGDDDQCTEKLKEALAVLRNG